MVLYIGLRRVSLRMVIGVLKTIVMLLGLQLGRRATHSAGISICTRILDAR